MLNTYWDNIKNDNLLAGQEQLDAELIYDTKFLYSKKSFPQRRSRLRLRYGFGKHFFPFFKISNELSVLADLRTDGVPKAQIRDIECEATQPIEKAEQEKQEAGLTYVTNLFPCLGFAPRSQSLACCAYAQAGSICSLSGFAHFVRVIRPQIRYSLIPL